MDRFRLASGLGLAYPWCMRKQAWPGWGGSLLLALLVLRCSDSEESVATEEPGNESTVSGLVDNEELPSSSSDRIDESNRCLGETRAAERIGLDMLIMLDSSASMLAPLPGQVDDPFRPALTKWDSIRVSLETFLQSPEASELGVGLQFFPQLAEGTPSACEVNADCGAGGPCSSSLCVNTELGFFGLDVSDIRPCFDADDCRPEELCATLPGECVVPPNTFADFPEGTRGIIEGMAPLCSEPAHCAALSGTVCEQIGLCASGTEFCSASLACPAGSGPCEGIPFVCTGRTQCEVEDYVTPAVPIASGSQSVQQVIEALRSRAPEGQTPTGPALQGALAAARAWAVDHPGRQSVAVLATDGFATECAPRETEEIAEIARQGTLSEPAVQTFVVGVFSESDLGQDGRQRLDTIAAAGGSQQAIVIDTAGDVAAQFLSALNQIRNTAVSCDFRLDGSADSLDFDRVNLRVTENGETKSLYNVGDAGACGAQDGWYYVRSESGAPRLIQVCEATCQRFRAGEVEAELEVGCATRIR